MKRPVHSIQYLAGAMALTLIFSLQSIASQVLTPPASPLSPPRPTVAALPANPQVTEANSNQVTIYLSSDRKTVVPGDLITLTIEIQNLDQDNKARGVESRYKIPRWLDLVSASASQGGLTFKNHTLKNTTGAIKPNRTARVTMIARVNRKVAEASNLFTAVTLVYREGSGKTVTRLSDSLIIQMQ
jgi:hypothetical protein